MSSAVQTIELVQKALRPIFPAVEPDGDIGKITRASLKDLAGMPEQKQLRVEIQEFVRELFPQVRPDGIFGPITFSALRALDELGDHESLAEEIEAGNILMPIDDPQSFQIVQASSFADPQDIAAFHRCKRNGGTDSQCFAKGDNGIGYWGADTTQPIAMVALPREVWRAAGKKGGAMVEVRSPGGSTFVAQLGDTMPALANIRNGAGMDCNPAACRKLGKNPPMMLAGVGWRWA